MCDWFLVEKRLIVEKIFHIRYKRRVLAIKIIRENFICKKENNMCSQNKPYNFVRFLIFVCFHAIIIYKIGKTMEQSCFACFSKN